MTTAKPLRIAVWHYLPSGGGRRALHMHVKGLLNRGHEVEIWCPDRVDEDFLPLQNLAPEHVVPVEWPEGHPQHSGPVALYRGARNDIKAMDRHCRTCAEQISAGGFDVLFANASMHYAVSAIGRFVDLPRLLYLQEPLRSLYEAAPHLPWRATDERSPAAGLRPTSVTAFIRHMARIRSLGILMREEQDNASAFDLLLVNSLYSRESILRAYGLSARVCHLGVDISLFQDRRLKRERTVIGVGAIVPAKAIERTIEAVVAVSADRPRLEWIGNVADADYRRQLEALAADRRMKIAFSVNLSDEELVRRLNRASAMVYAPRLEPFGFAPLEASACGLPVVGIAEAGIRETVRDGFSGLLVEDRPAAMAAAIERILGDPEFGRTLGANGRRWVSEEWTVDQAVGRLEEALVEVTSNPANGS